MALGLACSLAHMPSDDDPGGGGGWLSLVSFGGLASVGLSGLLLLLSNMENAKAVRLKGIECFEHIDGEAVA